MKELIEKVQEFESKCNHPKMVGYSVRDYATQSLRHGLMAEENDEYLEACFKGDVVGIADALGDMLYVLCGTILAHGMEDKIVDVFNEIHASNMSKFDANGNPIFNAKGKLMKSELYFKPDLKKVLYDSN